MPGRRRAPLLVVVMVTALLSLTTAFAATAANATPVLLGNTLLVTVGRDTGGVVVGSTFVMRDSRGTPITNTSNGKTYTLLSPGTTGLRLLAYDEGPTPAFDGSGNALAGTIVQPTAFFGVRFSVFTPRVDPVSGATNPLPQIVVNLLVSPATTVANFGAWTVGWNNQYFNQGATSINATSYNLRTGAIVLDWSSLITAGAFRGFTGNWHVEGFVTNL